MCRSDPSELHGTIRYVGWCETICYMNSLGFFEDEKQDLSGLTFAKFTSRLAKNEGADPQKALCDALKLKPWSAFILRMAWLGFFDDRPLPFSKGSPRDVVSVLFGEKLIFKPEEKDLVILCDEITAINPDGSKHVHKSVLVDFGVPGKWSSIAKTTGTPAAIAARYIAEKKIAISGVYVPTVPEIYVPVLEELKNEGIRFEEEA